MLVAKFTVPISRQIYTNVLKFASRDRQCSNKVQCKKAQNVKKEKLLSIPKECQEKLAKYPMPPNEYCKMESAVDNYQKAYQDTANQGETILKNFQDQSSLILDQLKKHIDASNANKRILLQTFSHDVKKKLQQLLILDPACGSLKRKPAMSLSHQARQAFENVECDTTLQVKRVKKIIEKWESDVLTCTGRAKSLIHSCCKCNNSVALTKCVEENVNYAKKILEKTSRHARIGLNKIEALQREILVHDKTTTTEVSRTYSEKNKAFLGYLDDCISAIREGKRR